MNRGKDKDYLVLLTSDPAQIAWDVETDVLVIGGGGCGLIASLAAAQKGAQVFLVEKEKAAGGNT
ncbi:MAG: FAD-binding protein, partial [Deltaproteobacteria bacterium]|nr:FAD-binding protein [Deltaproteobacteria bacterium]